MFAAVGTVLEAVCGFGIYIRLDERSNFFFSRYIDLKNG